MTALQITISGRVQGVGFRYYIFRAAQELRIKGIIKNLPDGKVYIEAEGDPQNIEIFLEKCREGPPLAYVTHIHITECLPSGYNDFRVAYGY
ncbi:MAG TPA: acylphosphatase [Bacteroidales bacterium]|jgi:acylphosphatase|nr:acylphosphatase [Bacteroidales bacterium]MDI9573211.1 acylphosphatase [Bacteroidota bacterium]OQC59101.1 MAG: Acylphosphatase [Bacteroidetes bacterium ADurb.Bin012]MBP9589267.1 acylphosphatase [Bacteroidales bacterium]NMD16869.1 acylphosphatase [Bacteroidales bacterium]